MTPDGGIGFGARRHLAVRQRRVAVAGRHGRRQGAAVFPLALRAAPPPPLRRRAGAAAARRARPRAAMAAAYDTAARARPRHRHRAAHPAPAGDGAADRARLRRAGAAGRRHARDDRAGRVRAGHRLRAGPARARRASRRAARRPTAQRVAVLGRRHGQARRARAQRVVRHRPDLRLRRGRRDRRRRRRARPHLQPRVLRQGRQDHLRPDRRHHRGRLRVPRRPGAAAERQLRPAGGVAWTCWRSTSRCRAANGSASPGSRAAWSRRASCVDERLGARRCARWCCPSSTAATSTTACSRGCASCTARSASTRRSAQRRPARARQRRQAVARRHPRDRVHRAAAAGGARRPVPRDPHALDAEGAAAAGRGRPDAAGDGRRAGRGPTRSCAASSTASSTWTTSRPTCCRRSDERPAPGSPRTMGYADCCPFLHELDSAPRIRGAGVRHAAGRRGSGDCKACNGPKGAQGARRPTWRRCSSSCRRSCASASRRGASSRACWRCATTRAPRLARLVARTGAVAGAGRACSEEAALRLVDWIEPLLRRESYLALLVERPEVHERLLRLLGVARWPMRYLMQHPGVIDELASDQLLSGTLRAAGFRARAGAPAPLAAEHRRGRRRGPARTCCAAPTTPRCSARWRATSKASSRWSRSPTT